MKRIIHIKLIILLLLLVALVVVSFLSAPHELHAAGSIRIPARGIEASVYTREAEPIDGVSSLWQGGTVTTDADLSNVQVGDYAHIYTTEGEHLVLECVNIMGCLVIGQTMITSWGRVVHANGDVLLYSNTQQMRVHVFHLARL